MSLYAIPSLPAYLNWNYLYPQYSLPWNNFFRNIQSNPFYLQNELNNVEAREIVSPLVFDANSSIAWVPTGTLGALLPPLSVLQAPIKSISSTSSKTFVGRYINLKDSINGLEYQYVYNMTASIASPVVLDSTHTSGVLVIGLNLASGANNLVKNDIVVITDGSGGVVTTVQGSITIGDATFSFSNAVPWILTNTPFSKDEVYYYINGNRIYLAVPLQYAGTVINTSIVSINPITSKIVETSRKNDLLPIVY